MKLPSFVDASLLPILSEKHLTLVNLPHLLENPIYSEYYSTVYTQMASCTEKIDEKLFILR